MQPLTNYRMGTGLAATIMGQQAGLEAEQQGLANTIKAMQMPQEALKGQEAAMLMQNPEYLQQKTANTMIELRNQYSAEDFQQTLNAANRIKIEMDAAGGDPAREQQVAQKALTALKIDPSSEFYQFAMKQPRKALDMFIQGTEASMAGAGGAKQAGAMQLAQAKGANALDLAEARGDIQSRLIGQRGAAGGNRPLSMTQYEAQLRIRAGQGDQQAIQELGALEQSRIARTTAGIEARNAPIMNLLQGRNAPAPQAKGGVIKLD